MQLIIDSTPLFVSGVFILGLLIGSFLNVVIIRLPKRLEYDWRCQCTEFLEIDTAETQRPSGVFLSRSRCPNCGHLIRFWENIPLLSYIWLGGSCHSCKKSISLRYPVVELVTAVSFAVVAWHFGPSIQTYSALLLTAYLIVLTGIDIDNQLLPDNLTLPLMWGGLILAIESIHTDLVSSVIGAAAGYLILWTIYHLFRLLTGKEGMGYGDFKIMAALGAWLGWQVLPLIVLLSSVIGAIFGIVLLSTGKLDREKPMPFGPFIACAGWVALIWGETLNRIYLHSNSFG